MLRKAIIASKNISMPRPAVTDLEKAQASLQDKAINISDIQAEAINIIDLSCTSWGLDQKCDYLEMLKEFRRKFINSIVDKGKELSLVGLWNYKIEESKRREDNIYQKEKNLLENYCNLAFAISKNEQQLELLQKHLKGEGDFSCVEEDLKCQGLEASLKNMNRLINHLNLDTEKERQGQQELSIKKQVKIFNQLHQPDKSIKNEDLGGNKNKLFNNLLIQYLDFASESKKQQKTQGK